jgi:hypothetical protein
MTPTAIIPAAPVPVRGSGPEGVGCVAAVLVGSTVVDTVPPSVVTLPGAVDDVVASGLVVEEFNGVVVDAAGAVVLVGLVVDDEPDGAVVDGGPGIVVVTPGSVVTVRPVVVVTVGMVVAVGIVVAWGTVVVVFDAIVQLWLKTAMPSDVQFLPS